MCISFKSCHGDQGFIPGAERVGARSARRRGPFRRRRSAREQRPGRRSGGAFAGDSPARAHLDRHSRGFLRNRRRAPRSNLQGGGLGKDPTVSTETHVHFRLNSGFPSLASPLRSLPWTLQGCSSCWQILFLVSNRCPDMLAVNLLNFEKEEIVQDTSSPLYDTESTSVLIEARKVTGFKSAGEIENVLSPRSPRQRSPEETHTKCRRWDGSRVCRTGTE